MTGGAAREVLLGVDVGTTSAKAAVVEPDGCEIAHGRAPMPWQLVPTGAEIAPAALVGAALDASREALTAVPGATVAALGVASMAETGVLIDGRGAPLAPAIAWHDSRGAEESRELEELLGDRFRERTGLDPRPLCSAVKHRWQRAHVPAVAGAVRRLGVAEWVVRSLGGDEQAELSLASRTGWLDLHARDWWDEPLEWSGAGRSLLPEPAVAGTPAGRVGDALPAARGAVLAIGGHDHLSAAVGAGAVGAGDVLDSCGTAEALIRATEPLPPARVLEAVRLGINVGWHAVPDRQCLLGADRTGAMLGRVMAALGHGPGRRAELEQAALTAPAGAGGVRVSGIAEDTTTIAGIGAGTTPGHIWRAALVAASESAAGILRNMERVAGPHTRLVVAGGWAEGAAARVLKQAALGPFSASDATFAGARGAALTAGRAAGLVAQEPGDRMAGKAPVRGSGGP
jgi:sugar (pentulose or hexulose) kinase